MKPLAQTPGEIVEIRDDDDAKALLLELGMLDKFPKPANANRSWVSRVAYPEHPTHWISATRFGGFVNPSENGYAVVCLPKSHFSMEGANRCLMEKYGLRPDEVEAFGFVPIEPPQN